MRSKGDKVEIIIYNEVDGVIKYFFDPLKNRYQNSLEPVKGNEFVLDYVVYYTINVIK